MPNPLTRGLPDDYRDTNRYCTAAAYRNGHREVDQECTGAIIQMTFTEQRSTETPSDAESRDEEAFREQRRTPIAVSMTTNCEAYVLGMNQ